MGFHPMTNGLVQRACIFELSQAMEEHGDKFNSMHEGYAILKEEVEEAESEFEFLDHYLEEVWESVKKNEEVITPADYIQNAVIRAMMELAQVWAVCEKMKNGGAE